MVEYYGTFVIIGGGIAGVTCVEQLAILTPNEKIILITATSLIKTAENIVSLTTTLDDFEIIEKESESWKAKFSNLLIIKAFTESIDPSQHIVHYKKLCICSGGFPRKVSDNACLITIRDATSLKTFQEKLKNVRKLIILGNGGIATEIVYELQNIDVVWAIKDEYIVHKFLDPDGALFLQSSLSHKNDLNKNTVTKFQQYSITDKEAEMKRGTALGPNWHKGLLLSGKMKTLNVHIEKNCQLERILLAEEIDNESILHDSQNWPVFVKLSNGKIIGCDLILSATGVEPDSYSFKLSCPSLQLAEDGGILVDNHMRSNIPDIYAAGDVCTVGGQLAMHWFQMRLWTQARQMGAYAAKVMDSDLKGVCIPVDFCFEIFSHVTHFFGFKIVLLGLYNGQKLKEPYDIQMRVTNGVEYVKVILQNGCMQGAILIGDTDLEETFENLILNQTNLQNVSDNLLRPDIDLEDYFD